MTPPTGLLAPGRPQALSLPASVVKLPGQLSGPSPSQSNAPPSQAALGSNCSWLTRHSRPLTGWLLGEALRQLPTAGMAALLPASSPRATLTGPGTHAWPSALERCWSSRPASWRVAVRPVLGGAWGRAGGKQAGTGPGSKGRLGFSRINVSFCRAPPGRPPESLRGGLHPVSGPAFSPGSGPSELSRRRS